MKSSYEQAGEYSQKWNGKDDSNRMVPAEAYHYTIEAAGVDGHLVEYDISDYTGGKRLKIKNVVWSRESRQFEYKLKKPARILLRIGLENNGPLLANVMNWVPRAVGNHVERWDGMDISGVIELSKHPKMDIDIQAYTLSKNTILVGEKPMQVAFVDIKQSKEKRKQKKIPRKRMVAAQQQAPETRGDYPAKLSLPEGLPKTDGGVPIVSGLLPVVLSVAQANNAVALNRRAESVFYVDGLFSFENEVGFLPMTWQLNTNELNEGEHYLSVNLRGYEGNFGLATIKIHVKNKHVKGK